MRYGVSCSTVGPEAETDGADTVSAPQDAGVASWQILSQLEYVTSSSHHFPCNAVANVVSEVMRSDSL